MSLRLLLILLVIVLLAGCATTRSDQLYQDLGQREGIEELSINLLMRSAEKPILAEHFGTANLDRLHAKLVEQICELSGGPCEYSGYSMREAHASHNLGNDEFNALVETLIDVMDDTGLPVPVQNRLLAVLAPLHRDVTAGESAETRSGTRVHETAGFEFSPELDTQLRR